MHLVQYFRDFLQAFAASSVELDLVGGYTVILHGGPRAAKDPNLLAGIDDDNRRRLAQAIAGGRTDRRQPPG